MHIHCSPSVVEVRIYKEGSYKERSPYAASLILYITDNEAKATLLTGMCEPGKDTCAWDAEADRQLMDYLWRIGVKKLHYTHKGREETRDPFKEMLKQNRR